MGVQIPPAPVAAFAQQNASCFSARSSTEEHSADNRKTKVRLLPGRLERVDLGAGHPNRHGDNLVPTRRGQSLGAIQRLQFLSNQKMPNRREHPHEVCVNQVEGQVGPEILRRQRDCNERHVVRTQSGYPINEAKDDCRSLGESPAALRAALLTLGPSGIPQASDQGPVSRSTGPCCLMGLAATRRRLDSIQKIANSRDQSSSGRAPGS